MAVQQVFPTKGNLIATKKNLQLAALGYELLDRKRNILIREIMTLVEKAKAEADALLADNEKSLSRQAEKDLAAAQAEAQQECDRISRNAEKNIGRVRELVVEMLTRPSV